MKKYYVTFGHKYANEIHPVSSIIHPNGYAIIEAMNIHEARSIAFETFGDKFAFLYSEEEWLEKDSDKFYPFGVLLTVNEDGKIFYV